MYYLRFALSTSSAWQGKGSTSQFLGFNWLPRFYARMSGVVYWVSASNFPFDWVLSSSASAKIVSSLGSSLNLGSPLEKTGCRARLWSILLGHWTTAGGGATSWWSIATSRPALGTAWPNRCWMRRNRWRRQRIPTTLLPTGWSIRMWQVRPQSFQEKMVWTEPIIFCFFLKYLEPITPATCYLTCSVAFGFCRTLRWCESSTPWFSRMRWLKLWTWAFQRLVTWTSPKPVKWCTLTAFLFFKKKGAQPSYLIPFLLDAS